LHPSTADNKVLKVADKIKFTLLANSVALQPVSQHSEGVSVSAVVMKLAAVTNVIFIIVQQACSRH